MAGTTTQPPSAHPSSWSWAAAASAPSTRARRQVPDRRWPAGAAAPEVDRNFALFAWDGNPNSAPGNCQRPRCAAQGNRRQLRIHRRGAWPRDGRHAGATAARQRRHRGTARRPRRTCPPPTRNSTASSCASASRGSTPPRRSCRSQCRRPAAGRQPRPSITLSFNEAVRRLGQHVLHKADGRTRPSTPTAPPRACGAFNVLKLGRRPRSSSAPALHHGGCQCHHRRGWQRLRGYFRCDEAELHDHCRRHTAGGRRPAFMAANAKRPTLMPSYC